MCSAAATGRILNSLDLRTGQHGAAWGVFPGSDLAHSGCQHKAGRGFEASLLLVPGIDVSDPGSC